MALAGSNIYETMLADVAEGVLLDVLAGVADATFASTVKGGGEGHGVVGGVEDRRNTQDNKKTKKMVRCRNAI